MTTIRLHYLRWLGPNSCTHLEHSNSYCSLTTDVCPSLLKPTALFNADRLQGHLTHESTEGMIIYFHTGGLGSTALTRRLVGIGVQAEFRLGSLDKTLPVILLNLETLLGIS